MCAIEIPLLSELQVKQCSLENITARTSGMPMEFYFTTIYYIRFCFAECVSSFCTYDFALSRVILFGSILYTDIAAHVWPGTEMRNAKPRP